MNILLGVSGGIACYKACELISKLKYLNHSIRVVMTPNASKFVSPMTFASLTGGTVYLDMWDEAENGGIDHIDVSQEWADLYVIAPATANVIGKFANGIADDYLTTMYMSANTPKLVCPAMNTTMLASPAVQRNLEILKRDGIWIVPPDEGTLACGTVGPGKLAAVDTIVTNIKDINKHYGL